MPKPPNPSPVGRIILHVECTFWNAYYAFTDTMDGAILLGSIRMEFVKTHARRQAFLDLMRLALQDIVQNATGHRPVADNPVPAPKHKKAGRA